MHRKLLLLIIHSKKKNNYLTQNRSRSLITIVDGQIAQSVEQRTENPRVGSSILPLATIRINELREIRLAL